MAVLSFILFEVVWVEFEFTEKMSFMEVYRKGRRT